MDSSVNFAIPQRKTEWDIFKEIVVLVILNSVLLSLAFVSAVYTSDLLPVEMYPLLLVVAGMYAVYRVIHKNKIVPDDMAYELINQCSGFPALKQYLALTLHHNTFIRKSDLFDIKSIALEELQCMKAMHQTDILLSNQGAEKKDLADLVCTIEAYSKAFENLNRHIKSL